MKKIIFIIALLIGLSGMAEGAGSLTSIYLNPVGGVDSNNGNDPVFPVKTWEKAISLAADNATIYVTWGSVAITSDMVINGSQFDATNVTVEPYSGYTGSLFTVAGGATGIFSNITLKGAGTAQVLLSVNSGGTLTIGGNMNITDEGQIALDGGANAINLTTTPSGMPYQLLTTYTSATDEGRPIANTGSIENPVQYFNLITPASNTDVGYELAMQGSTMRLRELPIGGIYLDPANGSDSYSGARSNRPLKTLTRAKQLWDSRNTAVPGIVTDIFVLTRLTLTNDLTLEDGIKLTRFAGDADRTTTMTDNLIVYTGIELTIKDATIDNGSISGVALYSQSSGTLILDSGATIISGNNSNIIDTRSYGNTTVEAGATITSTGTSGYCIYNETSSNLTVHGGTFTSSGNIFSKSYGALIINDATITHTGSSTCINSSYGTVTINGGTITTSGSSALSFSQSPFTMNGGTITSTRTIAGNTYLIYVSTSSSTVTINGGTINGGLSTAIYLSSSSQLNLIKGVISSTNTTNGTVRTSASVNLNGEDVQIGGIINMTNNNVVNYNIVVTSTTVTNNYTVRIADKADYTTLVRSNPVIDLGIYHSYFTLEQKPGYGLIAYANKGESIRSLVLYDTNGVYVNDFNGNDAGNSGLSPASPLKTLTAAAGKTSTNNNLNTIYICDSTLTISNTQSILQTTAKDTISTFMFRNSAYMVRLTSGCSLTLGNIAVYHKLSNALVNGYFYVDNGASITLESGASLFLNNYSSYNRYGIYKVGGTVTMNSGSLISNLPNATSIQSYGYGIYQSGAASQAITINGGAVIERVGYGFQSSSANGVVTLNDDAVIQYCGRHALVMSAGIVNIYKAIISNISSSSNYYSISVTGGTMNINGAIIRNNTYSSLNISGTNAVVNMMDGQIVNNNNSSSSVIGFVRVLNQATFNFFGGLIGRNTPAAGASYPIYGDQVYITSGGKMNFTGGRIVGTGEDKNAIYVHASGTTNATAGHLKISNAAVIDSGFIYCESPFFAPISLNDPLDLSKEININLGDNMAGSVLVDGAGVPALRRNFILNTDLSLLSLSQSGDSVVVSTSAIYLNGATGSDAFDGSTSALAVKTFARARDRLYTTGGNYIIVIGAANISNPGEISNWDLRLKSEAVVQRGLGYSGYLVNVPSGYSLTLSDITLDGNKENVYNASVLAIVNGSSATITINEGTKIQNNDLAGVASSGGIIYMNGGTITNNNSYGISLNSSVRTDSFVMTGGSITNNNYGIYNSYSRRYISITGGEISRNANYGIYNSASTNYYSVLKIGGDVTIEGNNSVGIYFSNLDSLIIEGGRIMNNGSSGLQSSSCRNVLITGGEIKSNGGYGLNVSSSSTENVGNSFHFSDMEISGNNTYGLSIGYYETCSLTRAVITNNGNYGFSCSNGKNLSITGSTVSNNKNYGVSVSSFSNTSVKNVNINNNSGYGLTVANSGVAVPGVTIVEDANIEFNSGYGISLTGFNNYNLSKNIRIIENKNSGIYSNSSLISEISGDLLIKGNKAASGGGINVSSGTVNITGNLTLEADTCTNNGGGIYVATQGTVNISGEMTIDKCVNTSTTATGSIGGSAIYALGRLSMTGGRITECKLVHNGTVLATGSSSDIRLTGVKIFNNTAGNGAAVYVNTGGRVTLDRDTIKNNTTTNLSYTTPIAGDIHIAGGVDGRLNLRDKCYINGVLFINSNRDTIFVDEALLSVPVGAFHLLARSSGNESSTTLVTRPGTIVVSPNGTTVSDASQFLSRFTLVNQNIGRGLDKGGKEEKHIIIVNQFFIDGTKDDKGDGANPLTAFNNISQLTSAILGSPYTTVWVSGPVTITGNNTMPTITTNNVNLRRYTGFDVAAQSFDAYDSVMITIAEGASLTIPGGSSSANNFTISGEGGSSLTDASIFKNNGTLTIRGYTTLFFNPTGGNGGAVYQNGIFNLSGNVEFNMYSTNTVYLAEGKVINIASPLNSSRPIGLTVETSPTNTHIPGRVVVTGTTTNVPVGMESKFVNEIAPAPLPIGRRVNGSTADLMFYLADRNVGAIPPIYISLQDAFDASVVANNDEVRLYGNTPEHVVVDKALRYRSNGHTVSGSFTLDSTSFVQLLDDLHADTLYIRAATFSKKAQLDRDIYSALITKAAYLDLHLPESSKVGDWYPINLPFESNVSDIRNVSDTTYNLGALSEYAIAEYSGQHRANFGIGNQPSNPNNDWQYFTGSVMNQGAAYMVTTKGIRTLRFKASDLNLFTVASVPIVYYSGSANNIHHGMNYLSQPMGINSIISGGIASGIIQVSESLSSDRIGGASYIAKSVGTSLVIAPYTNYFYQTGIGGNEVSYTKSNLAATVRSGILSSDNTYAGEAVSTSSYDVPTYYELRLHDDNPGRYDALFVAASPYASKEKYEIGRDVIKMGAVGNAMQLWSSDFDVALCANEVVLENRQADIPLFINTPVTGKEYKLNLKNVVSWSEQLWLCRHGKLVQNLTQYPEYVIEGVGGTLDEYSLRLMTGTTGNSAVEEGVIYVYTENKAIVISGMHLEDEYTIYDASGRLFAKGKANSNRERVNAVTGFYVIQINGKTYKAVVK